MILFVPEIHIIQAVMLTQQEKVAPQDAVIT
jgi:hypothetical protein